MSFQTAFLIFSIVLPGFALNASGTQENRPGQGHPRHLREWDPTWAEQAVKITTNPWTDGVLPTKFIELVCVGLNVSRTNLNPEGTRHHIRAAICGRREPSGNLVRSQMRVGHVHSFRQL
jgi:hypothetical protein